MLSNENKYHRKTHNYHRMKKYRCKYSDENITVSFKLDTESI